MLRNLWNQLLTRAVSPKAFRPKSRRRPSPIRPQLETLECRITPAMIVSSKFQGLVFGNTQGYVPPDTCGAAGTAQYLETVNQTLRISTKATGVTVATYIFDHFWYTVRSLSTTHSTSFLSDPIGTCDYQIHRFILGD